MQPGPKSLQETYAPSGRCFGCGTMNEKGLRIQSFFDGKETTCQWIAQKHHEAFDGFLNGGIISSLLDCHCNWAAIAHFLDENAASEAPCTVTAKLNVEFLAPTPTGSPIELVARVAEAKGRKFSVQGELNAGGIQTAKCDAIFVIVRPEHPAYHRW